MRLKTIEHLRMRLPGENHTIPRHIFFTAFGIWTANILLYYPSLTFGFINFDDYTVLLGQPLLYNESSFISSLKEIFLTSFPREEPLLFRDVTWALDSYFFGFKNPFGYHLGNVVLNSFNAVLLWLFLYLITGKEIFAFIVSFLFSVLPVHVEPVCWVMGRKDLLVTFFMLLGLIFQEISLRSTDDNSSRALYLLTIAAALAAMLSKINALTYFGVLAAHRFFHPLLTGGGKSGKSTDTPHLFHGILPKIIPHMLISIFIFLWYRGIISDWGVLDRGVDSFSLYHLKNLLILTPIVFGLYLKLIFFPYGHSIFYQWPSIHQAATTADMLFSITAVSGGVLFSIFLFRKKKALLFYWIVFLFLMLPYLNIQYIGIWIANRYVYFSLFCILSIVTAFVLEFLKGQRRGVMVLALILLVGYASLNIFQTWRYQHAWRSDFALWKYESSLNSPSLMAVSTLADIYIKMARSEVDETKLKQLYDNAESALERGVAVFENDGIRETAPHLFNLYYYKGILTQQKTGDLHRSLKYYQKAYDLKPGHHYILYKMAEIHYRMALAEPEEGKKEILARKSLHYFTRYVDAVSDDLDGLQRSLLLLNEGYEKNFDFLDLEIDAMRGKIVAHLSK